MYKRKRVARHDSQCNRVARHDSQEKRVARHDSQQKLVARHDLQRKRVARHESQHKRVTRHVTAKMAASQVKLTRKVRVFLYQHQVRHPAPHVVPVVDDANHRLAAREEVPADNETSLDSTEKRVRTTSS